ncbi:phytoene desaturase family protein [Promicromonospora soli]
MTDAVVVGAGPNGLAAALVLARAGLTVTVLEEQDTPGGGARTLDLGLAPGIVHDICSAAHPMAWASPFLSELGIELLTPEVSYAQPLPGARAGIAYRSLDRTVEGLGADGPAWGRLVGRLSRDAGTLAGLALGDLRRLPGAVRRSPTSAKDLALLAGLGARVAAAGTMLRPGGERALGFRGDVAPALLAGVATHAITPLPSVPAAAVALLLAALAHGGAGWPVPRGGSQAIVDALIKALDAAGAEIVTGHRVASRADLPPARAYLFDTAPEVPAAVFGDRMPAAVRRRLAAPARRGAASKVDFVLSGPVPWEVPDVGRAGTVHLSGTLTDVARAEADVAAGRHAERPVCLVSDPAVVDPGRTSGGVRPLWAYAHVPLGSDRDVTQDVVRQIERFAPGFRDVVVDSRCVPAARMAHHDAALVGGDILGGALTLPRLALGPARLPDPYATGVDGVWLCSSSTPPGPGVHGLSGVHAARRALRRLG